VLTLFQIFSGRIAAEIERVEYEGQLVELNNSLEDKVKARTIDLENTIHSLNKAQSKLIESEKLAALGNLVAGVAHEVNTPLGVTITAQSIVEEKFKLLCQLLDTNSLTVEAMNDFRSTMTDTLPLMASNLSRAVTLLTNFKKTAADQHNEKLELINFFDYCQQVLSTLHPLSKQVGVSIETNIDKTIQLKTYPGIYAQIITNLVTNSLNHAFDDTKNKLITISLNKLDDGHEFTYIDNGIGLSDEAHERIFEPFFTTARNTGGIGLGMSIVYNLVNKKLNGNVELLTPEKGFGIRLNLPKIAEQ
jgi:signal transduction histidine kinase